MSADDNSSGGETSTSMAGETCAVSEYHEHMIEVFIDYILDNMRVAHLLLDLHLEEVRRIIPRLHKLENDGNTREANKQLILAIRQSRDPNRWKMFFGALRQDGASVILDRLLAEKQDQWNKLHEQHRELIAAFTEKIQEDIDLLRILNPALKHGLIYKEDAEELREEYGRHRLRAVGSFLLLVHRLKSDWYKVFMTILNDNGYSELAKHIDPFFIQKLCKERAEAEKERDRGLGETEGSHGGHSKHALPQTAASGQSEGAGLDPARAGAQDKMEEQKPPHDKHQTSSQFQHQPVITQSKAAPPGGATSSTCCNCERLTTELAAMGSKLTADMAEIKLMLRQMMGAENSSGQP